MKYASTLLDSILTKLADEEMEGEGMASAHSKSNENNGVSGTDKKKLEAKKQKKLLEQMRGRQTEETEDGET